MLLIDEVTYNEDHKNVFSNQQISQETQYLLSTSANRKALKKGMEQAHSGKILTPEEWERLKLFKE